MKKRIPFKVIYLRIIQYVFAMSLLSGCYKINDRSDFETGRVKSRGDSIIDRAIEYAGGEKFLNLHVEFDFRGRHYVGKRKHGLYQYERIFSDSTGLYRDILNNEGFVRQLNDEEVMLPDTMAAKYTRSVNSVLYFGLLPFGLNDGAVRKKFLGEGSLKGKEYYKVMVTFEEEGGGDDYEDVFIYWIGKENYKIDYFAYTYVTDGGGSRFREAINPRVIEGILFQDYINYKPREEGRALLLKYDSLFESGLLEELSTIETENIVVKEWDGRN
ncbi:MAG: hypothetical protein OEY51_02165 [Cyclobacteriaceae bacterium]|nr:hypothetical protein [Cyclobacteriaceae bacterium]